MIEWKCVTSFDARRETWEGTRHDARISFGGSELVLRAYGDGSWGIDVGPSLICGAPVLHGQIPDAHPHDYTKNLQRAKGDAHYAAFAALSNALKILNEGVFE